MPIYKLGNFFGWLTVVLFAGTIANYVIKIINRKWGKQLSSSPAVKNILTIFIKVFVKNHRYFGFGAIIALFLHFIIQFFNFGFSISGMIAAALLFLQAILGIYASMKKKPRKGAWFIIHRSIAVLLILGMAFHLLLPSVIHPTSPSPAKTPSSTASAEQKTFTLSELSKFNGQNGQPAYIAYKGIVYDVSNVPQWNGGTHHGENAGVDVTSDISKSPHGETVFADLPQVGTLKS